MFPSRRAEQGDCDHRNNQAGFSHVRVTFHLERTRAEAEGDEEEEEDEDAAGGEGEEDDDEVEDRPGEAQPRVSV